MPAATLHCRVHPSDAIEDCNTVVEWNGGTRFSIRELEEAHKPMPVQIGVKAHNFTEPTGLLSDCHRRIEMFLGSLQAVAKVVDHPVSDEARTTLESALRYFREAAPKHNADEEESLFPRLRNINHPDVQVALAKIDELEKDHRWAAPLHEEVERLGHSYLSNGILSAAEAERFRSAVARLRVMYREHIHIEDDLVFPQRPACCRGRIRQRSRRRWPLEGKLTW